MSAKKLDKLDNLVIGEIYFKLPNTPLSMEYTRRGKWFTRGNNTNYITEDDIANGIQIDQLINDSEWTYYFISPDNTTSSFTKPALLNIITKEEYKKKL
jgi:hypothetical protein